ncbi:MAG: hypothetical protein MP439_11130 [Ferrimicrobium sp.]|jgi:hypothetical protein|nr:hypothetical protein [Ferrimicrobium sp.]
MASSVQPEVTEAQSNENGVVETFEIVPRRGLIVAAVWLIGLVVALLANTMWAVDFFHVVSGALWTAIDLFVGFIVGPILGKLSIPARAEFSKRFMPKMIVLMPTLVISTLAAGIQLARIDGYLVPSSPGHSWVVASFFVVGIMTLVAIGFVETANIAVLFELRKQPPNGELLARLMRRFIYTAAITGAMQVATLIIMTRLASL